MRVVFGYYLSAILYSISLLETAAYPSQAGHCNKGPIGNQSGYIGPHGSQGGGSLSVGNYVVKVDGEEISNIETTILTAGQEYTFTLEKDGNHDFRGFMFRLEDGMEKADVSGAFTVVTTDHMQLHPACSADDISAVTHNNGYIDKSMVSFKFKLDQPLEFVRLDTTVVRDKAWGNWFYSLFNLKIVSDGGGGNTEAPSAQPSAAPSAQPTDTASAAPSAQPTDTASAAPSAAPTFTSSPTSVPSDSSSPFCVDSPLKMWHKKKKLSCRAYLKRKIKKKCNENGVASHCALSCKKHQPSYCAEPTNSKKKFFLTKDGAEFTCTWVKDSRRKRCARVNSGVAKTCRRFCKNYL